jgi:serine/threonine protein kinase
MHNQELKKRRSCAGSLTGTAGPKDFERLKLIGQGDVGKVYLVRLKGSNHTFAMKVLSKQEMIARNKVRAHRTVPMPINYHLISIHARSFIAWDPSACEESSFSETTLTKRKLGEFGYHFVVYSPVVFATRTLSVPYWFAGVGNCMAGGRCALKHVLTFLDHVTLYPDLHPPTESSLASQPVPSLRLTEERPSVLAYSSSAA